MKTLIQILLLALLVGCASPYYPVYLNDEGDYYVAERSADGPYYGTGYYPWWLSGYPPQTFAYYSPYFYPYYFSVWYPPVYHPYYSFHGGYYGYWRPPYHYHRHGRHHGYPDKGRVVVSPALPPAAVPGQVVTYPGLPVNRNLVNLGGKGHRVVAPPRSAGAYNGIPAQSFVPASRTSSTSPARFNLPSAPTGSAVRGKEGYSKIYSRHRQ